MLFRSRELTSQDEKKNPQDFALWKKAEPQHIMRWPSPWGDGFPGWHLECTAMSTKYLGEQFDIHGGGMDLKFPHHECEIAQAEACNSKSPVNYWLHANMLTLNGKKMSKSTGNNVYPSEMFSGNNDILSKAYSPAVVRFFMMQAHYTSILDLSDNALQASEKGYHKLMQGLKSLTDLPTGSVSSFDVKKWSEQCYAAMNDDFNTPILIAHLFDAVKHINLIKEGRETITEIDKKLLSQTFDSFVFDVLGLEDQNESDTSSQTLEGVVNLLIELRNKARANKDFETSDTIRDELTAMGIQLKDGKEGTTFSIN